jgi:hypothetical protein
VAEVRERLFKLINGWAGCQRAVHTGGLSPFLWTRQNVLPTLGQVDASSREFSAITLTASSSVVAIP